MFARTKTTKDDFLKAHPDALSLDDEAGRKARAVLHALAGGGIFRKFGYVRSDKAPFHPPLEFARNYTPQEKGFIEKLKIIESYAGYMVFDKSDTCVKCGRDCRIGYRDFVFRPLPGGFTYRWPEGLGHYFQYHHSKIPDWLPELAQEFDKAQSQGLWR